MTAASAAPASAVEVTVHVEPIEARQSWHDSELLPVEEAAGIRSPSPPSLGG